jgi:hypothetical protein
MDKIMNTEINLKKIIYLASPYSHPNDEIREQRFKDIAKISAELNSQGIIAFSPIVYGHTLLDFKEMPTDWQFWQTFCLSFLQHSDELHVYKMDGWEMSSGIAEEIKFAEKNNIPVKFFEF